MKKRKTIKFILQLLLITCVILCFLTGIRNLRTDQSDESARLLQAAIKRSAAACYAAEGVYPPDLDYLEEHYGLQIDTGRYGVDYEVFASNLMPDITVWVLE